MRLSDFVVFVPVVGDLFDAPQLNDRELGVFYPAYSKGMRYFARVDKVGLIMDNKVSFRPVFECVFLVTENYPSVHSATTTP